MTIGRIVKSISHCITAIATGVDNLAQAKTTRGLLLDIRDIRVPKTRFRFSFASRRGIRHAA